MVFRIIKFQLVRIDDGVVYSVIVVVVIVDVIAVIVDVVVVVVGSVVFWLDDDNDLVNVVSYDSN